MKKLNFSTRINASRERVWQTLWNDSTYRQWTAVFHEGSYAKSDWQEGSKIQFLSPDGNGMTSRIARLEPNEFMSFEHLGEVKDGVEDFTKKWAGAFENYRLKEEGNATLLLVDIDSDDEFASYFEDAFPKALEKIKEISELP